MKMTWLTNIGWLRLWRSFHLLVIALSVLHLSCMTAGQGTGLPDTSGCPQPDNQTVPGFSVTGEEVLSFMRQIDQEINDRINTLDATVMRHINTLQARLNTMDSRMSALSDRTLRQVQSSLNELDDKISDLADEMSSMPSASESMKNDETVVDLKKQVKNVKKDLSNLGEDIHDLGREFLIAIGDLNSLQDEAVVRDEVEEWPEGVYALLRPKSGCPNDKAFVNSVESYGNIHSESSVNGKNKDGYSRAFPSTTVKQTGRGNFITLRFCEAEDHGNGEAWPQGSYCVAKQATAPCPDGFETGSVRLNSEDDVKLSEVAGNVVRLEGADNPRINFCCMASGSASTPVVLPTASPFLLFRRGDECQAVEKMDVSEEMIAVDTEDEGNIDKVTGTAPDVDKAKNEPTVLHACYYRPTF